MTKSTELLIAAAGEIKALRRQNEILAAKLYGAEMMAMAVQSKLPPQESVTMSECIVHKIERHLNEEKCNP